MAFESYASDLVTGDGNGYQDVFVRDLVAGTTVRAVDVREGTRTPTATAPPSAQTAGPWRSPPSHQI